MIFTTSSTNMWSGVIFVYHVCTNSLIMIAMRAYNSRSTSLLLVNGGRISLIGAGVLRPFSPSWEHNVRRIKNRVARSETGSVEGRRVFARTAGMSDGWGGSSDASAGRDDMFVVDLGRDCN